MPSPPLRPTPFPLPHPIEPSNSPLTVQSFAELAQHQPEIVQRLNAMRNGPTLFSIHPVQALLDVGVTLAPPLAQELWKALDTIQIPVPAAYRELKKTNATQRVTASMDFAGVRGGQ